MHTRSPHTLQHAVSKSPSSSRPQVFASPAARSPKLRKLHSCSWDDYFIPGTTVLRNNTRTQFVFFSELSRQAGYELDVTQFAENAPLRTEFVQARFYNQSTMRTDRLETVLGKALTEIEPPSPSNRQLTTMERLARRSARQHPEDKLAGK